MPTDFEKQTDSEIQKELKELKAEKLEWQERCSILAFEISKLETLNERYLKIIEQFSQNS